MEGTDVDVVPVTDKVVLAPDAHQSLRIQDIADRLTLAGLAPEEARVYLHLVVRGPRAAGIMARELQLNRAAVYRVLGRLGEQDLVRSDGGHPTVFAPAPIEEVIDDLVARQQARVRDLQGLRGRIEGFIESLRRASDPTPTSVLKVIRGRQEILLITDLMTREATRSIHLALTDASAWGTFERSGGLANMARCAESGIQLTIVGPATLSAEQAQAAGAIRARPGEHVNVLVADRRDALTWIVLDESQRLSAPGDQAMWTNHGDFAGGQADAVARLGQSGRAVRAPRPVGPT